MRNFSFLEIQRRTISCALVNQSMDHHTFYSRCTEKALRKQLALASLDQVVLRRCTDVLDATNPLQTQIFRTVYQSVRPPFWGFTNIFFVWNENAFIYIALFWYSKRWHRQFANTLKGNNINGYPVYKLL